MLFLRTKVKFVFMILFIKIKIHNCDGLICELISYLAPNDQQKTVHQPTSGGYANSSSNGVPMPSSNEASDMANFHSKQRLTQSTPGSPQEHGRPTSFEVIGSAESLVGRVRTRFAIRFHSKFSIRMGNSLTTYFFSFHDRFWMSKDLGNFVIQILYDIHRVKCKKL